MPPSGGSPASGEQSASSPPVSPADRPTSVNTPPLESSSQLEIPESPRMPIQSPDEAPQSASPRTVIDLPAEEEYHNRAFTAVGSWDNSSAPKPDRDALDFQPGDEGFLTHAVTDGRHLYYQARMLPDDRRGYIPADCVEIGTGIGGYLTVRINGFSPVRTDFGHNPPAGDTVLEKTIRALLRAFGEKASDELEFLRDTCKDALSDNNKRYQAGHQIIQGIKDAGLWDFLKNGPRFTVGQLRSHGRKIDKDTKKTGIYLRVYHTIWRLYTGQTRKSFGERNFENGHDGAINKNDQSLKHYRDVQGVKDTDKDIDKIQVCVLPVSHGKPIFDIAEQIVTLLFESYSPGLNQQDVQHGVDLDPNTSEEERLDSVKNLTGAAREAFCLQSLAADVFSQTGWPGAVQRNDFVQGNTYRGLNWDSPAGRVTSPDSHHQDQLIWTRVVGTETTEYHRPALTAVRNKNADTFNVSVCTSRPKGKGHVFGVQIPLNNALGLENGDTVYAVVEITNDGRPHATPYLRAPALKVYDDQDEALQVGIRLDSKADDGTWNRVYVQSSGRLSASEPVILRYPMVLGLKKHLEQRIIANSPIWMQDVSDAFGVAKVVDLGFNHMLQQYTLSDIHGPDTPTQVAQRFNNTNIVAQYQQANLTNIDVPWPTTHPSKAFSGIHNRRSKCDSCFALRNQGLGKTLKQLCEHVPGTNRCQLCTILNRVCSWSPDEQTKTPAAVALLTSVKAPDAVYDLGDEYDVQRAVTIGL